MSSVLTAAGIMAGLGFFFAGVLAVAYRFLHVPEDPRLDQVEAMLPSTNCGACGEPGCRAFAEALLEGRQLPGGCTVSSPEAVEAIAEFLGVDVGSQERTVARLHCAGGRAQARQIAEYEGYETCRAASLVAGGGKGCSWGCLGLADCEVSCDFDAIHMNANGLPVVDVVKCTSCGDCVEACPRDLFEILPVRQPLLVQCRVPLAGEEARALCRVACDACGRCAQDAPPGLIEMVNELPAVNYEADIQAGPEATYRCPTRAIQWVPAGQFQNEEPFVVGERRYAKTH
ncbi:MAG: Fe-S cluster protein [Candidatus Eisenbacteria bacterium]|nr:Fe-S cluster protein [Candidatus Eisenbacteria bacterium]